MKLIIFQVTDNVSLELKQEGTQAEKSLSSPQHFSPDARQFGVLFFFRLLLFFVFFRSTLVAKLAGSILSHARQQNKGLFPGRP